MLAQVLYFMDSCRPECLVSQHLLAESKEQHRDANLLVCYIANLFQTHIRMCLLHFSARMPPQKSFKASLFVIVRFKWKVLSPLLA